MRHALRLLILPILILGAAVPCTLADDAETALHQRAEDRYPKLKAAEEQGKLGESFTGFVEAVDPKYLDDADLNKLMQEENADRAQLYQIIATQTQSTADEVAQRAAVRNFAHAEKGEYLKTQDKGWQQKQ
jgi:uncharacterized protein YdbL (DUF1318 family)